jgi:AraC-like DNA-binding protein
MVLTGPDLPHLWKNDKAYHIPENRLETHGVVIYFPDNFLNNSVFQLHEFESIAGMLRKSTRGIEIKGKTNMQVRQMMVELIQMKGVKGIVQLLKILQTITDSTECKLIADAAYINTNKESEKDKMGQVYEYVMHNYQGKVSLQEAAQLSNLSVSSFSRFFKSRMNKSFTDFVTEVRISHACKLLHETDLNISEISYECGFFTLSNFNKLFKERVKKTPVEYRRA